MTHLIQVVHASFLALCLTLASLAMGQEPSSANAITAEDFFAVFRLFTPEDSARQMASVAAGTDRATFQAETGATPVSGITIGDDVLIIMSLLTEQLRKKVDAYRAAVDPRFGNPDEQRRWDQRRAELGKALRQEGVLPPVQSPS